MSRSAIIELFPGKDGKWYFHKKAGNGQITQDSQGYKQRRYAVVAIKREFPGMKVVNRMEAAG